MGNDQYYGQPTMAGYNYGMGGVQPAPKFMNTLTPEEIQKLQAKGNQFSLGITEEERNRGICNHRTADGTSDALIYDPLTNQATCSICGYKFQPIDPTMSIEDIQADVDRVVDILQTTKLMYVNLPVEAGREFYQIIPLMEKIPQLFQYAAKDMSKYESIGWQYSNRNMGAMNLFNNLQQLFAGGAQPNYGFQQQPPMYGQPNYGAQPQAQPGNGFGYPGASAAANPLLNNGVPPMAPGYQPQTAGYSYIPGAPAPVAPTVDVPNNGPTTEEITVAQPVTV